jgi:hypothetical protein
MSDRVFDLIGVVATGLAMIVGFMIGGGAGLAFAAALAGVLFVLFRQIRRLLKTVGAREHFDAGEDFMDGGRPGQRQRDRRD